MTFVVRALAALSTLLAVSVATQPYLNKSIRVIQHFLPAGGTDISSGMENLAGGSGNDFAVVA